MAVLCVAVAAWPTKITPPIRAAPQDTPGTPTSSSSPFIFLGVAVATSSLVAASVSSPAGSQGGEGECREHHPSVITFTPCSFYPLRHYHASPLPGVR